MISHDIPLDLILKRKASTLTVYFFFKDIFEYCKNSNVSKNIGKTFFQIKLTVETCCTISFGHFIKLWSLRLTTETQEIPTFRNI